MEEGELVRLNCLKMVKMKLQISDEIEKKKKIFDNNITILVRTYFKLENLRKDFKIGLPYRILGGIKFYERLK